MNNIFKPKPAITKTIPVFNITDDAFPELCSNKLREPVNNSINYKNAVNTVIATETDDSSTTNVILPGWVCYSYTDEGHLIVKTGEEYDPSTYELMEKYKETLEYKANVAIEEIDKRNELYKDIFYELHGEDAYNNIFGQDDDEQMDDMDDDSEE